MLIVELSQLDPASIPAADIPAAMTVLAALQVALATRLVAAPETSEPAASAGEDEMLTPEDAAIMLKQTRRWLSRNSKRLPFVKRISERSFVCSKQGILKWLASRRA